MERDKFTCSHCHDQERTLNVHHKYYVQGRLAWDYPDTAFITLCEGCHVIEENKLKQKANILFRDLRRIGLCADQIAGFGIIVENFIEQPERFRMFEMIAFRLMQMGEIELAEFHGDNFVK